MDRHSRRSPFWIRALEKATPLEIEAIIELSSNAGVSIKDWIEQVHLEKIRHDFATDPKLRSTVLKGLGKRERRHLKRQLATLSYA